MLQSVISQFRRDEKGTTAMLFTLTFAPVLMLAGIAIDLGRAVDAKSSLQNAVDTAAFAAGKYTTSNEMSQQSSLQERRQLIDKFMQANSGSIKLADLRYQVSSQGDLMTVTATGSLPTTVSAIIQDKFPITVAATVRLQTRHVPVCIGALNRSASQAFRVWGTADIVSTGCSMISNSSSPTGMVTGGSASATADLFCSAGGTSGSGFSPDPETNCARFDDPYRNKYSAAALVAQGINVNAGCNQTSNLRVRNNTNYNAGGATNVMVFCNGMRVENGGTANFGPGVYVFYGELEVQAQGRVRAPAGVTFFFADGTAQNGRSPGFMTVRSGGHFELTAPTSGYLEGMAIIQPNVVGYSESSTPITNLIIGGGTINIVGVVYTPQSRFRVTGNGTVNPTSPFFQLLADRVEIEGNGQLTVNNPYDPEAAGMSNIVSYSPGGEVALIR